MKKTAQNAQEESWDVVVIGGGPSGMMAAGRAAEKARQKNRTIKVLLLEKNPAVGKKLLITGGGRCNLTNDEPDNRVLLDKFKDSGKFLFSAFAKFSVKETLEFFHSRGLETKVENDQRVFPVSDTARSVRDVLAKYLEEGHVTVKSGAEVSGFIQTRPGHIDAVKLKNGAINATISNVADTTKNAPNGTVIKACSFILATGGLSYPETGSTGQGFDWLAKIGHTIVKLTAALVPIKVSDSWVKALSGVSLKDAKLTLFQDGKKVLGVGGSGKQAVKHGKILFTHFGLSGPAILNMSSEIGELLRYGEVVLSLDLLPQHDYSTLNVALQDLFKKEDKKKFKNAITGIIPAAFVPVIMERSNIDPDTFCNSVTRDERLALVKLLKDLHIHPTGLLGADKAIITSGGVALEEVDFRTMQSRRIANLYLVGDILNVDRPSGGFSLQLCWTTGCVAGDSVSSELSDAAVLSRLPTF
jgi:hypothetical protein